MKTTIQYKSFNTKALDVDKSTVKIAIANFSEVDKVGDLIDKKAFDKTLKENKRKWLFINHNPDLYVKKFDDMYVDGDYLVGIADLNIENQNAKDLLTAYGNNEISEHSIGYSLSKNGFKQMDGFTLLTEINLYEGSALTVPAANPNTPFLGFKALNNNDKKEFIKKQLQSIDLQFTKNLTRNNYKLLEYKYLQLRNLLNDLLESEPQKINSIVSEISNNDDFRNLYINLLT